MATVKAHELSSDKYRTDDVKIHENVDFKGLLLSESVLQGLTKAGFVRPSPIQLQALPLGRCGLDLIVQAKSGTGKTCVFTVIALESINLQVFQVQVLVLAPTREIALQISQVVMTIGSCLAGLRCYAFIGGIHTSEDIKKLKRCHIAVGTPGRVKQLIDEGYLKTNSIRLFVLDEADKLLDENFQKCINHVYSSLPENKQMIALSATYPEALAQLLTRYMQDPTFVRLSAGDPALLGVKQFYDVVPFRPLPHQAFDSKVAVLLHVLNSVAFNQCLVFSNFQTKAQTLSDLLVSRGWASVYISGSQDQMQRMQAMDSLQKFHCRILISTDLTARGIDVEHVNLVINMDVPWDMETYLHRIGRAGRFGSAGLAITIASSGKEEELLKKIKREGVLMVNPLPKALDNDIWKHDSDQPVLCDASEFDISKEKEQATAKSTTIVLNRPNVKTDSTLTTGFENEVTADPLSSGDFSLVQKLSQQRPSLQAKEMYIQNGEHVAQTTKDVLESDYHPELESERGFLSDVSKQLEGIQRQLQVCSQQYHERVDPIRAETPKLTGRRRLSRRNSLTELGHRTSSSDEEDRGRPSVRRQKRKCSKSRKGSGSRSRKASRSRRSSIGTDKVVQAGEEISSDSNVDESLAVLAGEFNGLELDEEVVPEDIVASVIKNHPKKSRDTSGLSFQVVADELATFMSAHVANDVEEVRTDQQPTNSCSSITTDNTQVHKCARPLLDYVVTHCCSMQPPDKVKFVDKYLSEQRTLLHSRIRSLLREAKKKAKQQQLIKKLEAEVQTEEANKNLPSQEAVVEDEADEFTRTAKSILENVAENASVDQTVFQKLDLGLPDVIDVSIQMSSSEAEITSKESKDNLANEAPKGKRYYNQDFIVSDDNSTELAVSSFGSDSEDDEAASGETSSDSSSSKPSKPDPSVPDIGASGDAGIRYSRSNADLSSRDYWSHHQIGDWDAYWKSYREWTHRADTVTLEKSGPFKQQDKNPVTASSGAVHECSHCSSPNMSWSSYYHPYYSWTSPSQCQVCQNANRWSQYYENQQASAAWWNYYWKYQQWQGYIEHLHQPQH